MVFRSPEHVCVQWETLRRQAVQESLCGKVDLQGSSLRKNVQSETTERTPETPTMVYGKKKRSSEDIPVFTQHARGAEGNHEGAGSWAPYSVAAPPPGNRIALHCCWLPSIKSIRIPRELYRVQEFGHNHHIHDEDFHSTCRMSDMPESWGYKDGRDLKSPEALGEGARA